jgi:DNA-binding transcriptional LysR family regulator
MDMLNGMRLFTEVVKSQGFAAASRKLGMVPSSVSRQISALEEALGARLLNRSTRKLSLTEAGELYYDQARRILSELDDANTAVSQFEGQPRGTLRLSTPVAFGRLHVIPALAHFLDRYPELRVDLVATDQVVDIVESGIDVALRMGTLQNSSLVARKLASDRYVICGSPSYLDLHPPPRCPEDLAHHNCLTYKYTAGTAVWTFKGRRGPEHVEVSGNLQADSFGALKSAAMLGMGLALLPIWSAMPCLRSGQLVTVLREYPVFSKHVEAEGAIYAVYPHRKQLSPKVRAFVDFIVEYIGDPPYWELN